MIWRRALGVWLMLAVQGFCGGRVDLEALRSPILFRGDASNAYRDPAVLFEEGWFRLFFTWVRIEDGLRTSPRRAC